MSNNSNILNSKIITKSKRETTLDTIPRLYKGSIQNDTDQTSITDCHHLMQNNIKSRIDYLTIQLMPINKEDFLSSKKLILHWLSLIGIKHDLAKPNLKYFDQGCLLKSDDLLQTYCGAIKWNKTLDIIQLELSGNGCQYVNTHEPYLFIFKCFAKKMQTIIRRLDIALDTFDKKHNLRFVQQAYSRGLYNSKKGRAPTRKNTSSDTGKSIRIGSDHSFKQQLIYEKGKQLGFPAGSIEFSNWTSHELKLRGRKNQPIPIDALFFPDIFFVGAYPKVNTRLVKNAIPRIIKREVIRTVDKTLKEKLAYAKHQVGKTIFGAVQRGLDSEVIVQTIMREGKKDNICYPSFVSKQDLENYVFESE